MNFSENFLRKRLESLSPFLENSSLEFSRRGQERLSVLMASSYRRSVTYEAAKFDDFEAAWIYPKNETRRGIIYYIHGGGYTSGGIKSAKGFGTVLACKCGARVFCVAYRLAPEYPYPTALEDVLAGYKYLLGCGYAPNMITLCGESAGGGLVFSLCLKLGSLGLPLPAGVIAASPWVDLTFSGESYTSNADKDPTLSLAKLKSYAEMYSQNAKDPLVSPLFGDLGGMPPSLIFVGSDELLLDDAKAIRQKLEEAGSKSTLVVADRMWHAFILYGVKERKDDFTKINDFLNAVIKGDGEQRWLKLDNAGKIYPAARRKTWTNMYRVSATLTDDIDNEVLQTALNVTIRRFPSIAVRVRAGVFWYYLEELKHAPEIEEENPYPMTYYPFSRIKKCGIRVFSYKNRIAVELFHGLTDGNGAMVFLKTLVAEYITQKYGADIPAEKGVLSRHEFPRDEEMEDSFGKYSGDIAKSRSERDAYKIPGTPESDGFQHITTFMGSVPEMKAKAKEYGVTLNTFFVAAFMKAILRIQEKRGIPMNRRKPVKILVPVNLRRIFPTSTLRNFAMFVTPEIDARFGDYSFEELCKLVYHQLGHMITPKEMAAKIAPNVAAERKMILRIVPLFLKNIAMRMVYDKYAERKSCLCLSNLGAVDLPDEMKKYVVRLDFILGVQATLPCNCGILSYGDTIYMNFIRNTCEPYLEQSVYEVMRELGIKIKVESNGR